MGPSISPNSCLIFSKFKINCVFFGVHCWTEEQFNQMRRNERNDVKIRRKKIQQYELSWFTYMEAVLNMESFVWNFRAWKTCRRCFSYNNPQFFAKILGPEVCCFVSSSSQLLFRLYWKILFFVSVSNELHEKHLLTYDYCVSNHNSLCSSENFRFHLDLVGVSLCQFLQGLENYSYITQEIHCI